MSGTKAPASCATIELEIPIEAPCERVWEAIFKETNFWWMPNFRVSGENSQVTFDPTPGGRGMVEESEDGGGLLWFTVQMYLPSKFAVYLFGHIAPEWGGPQTSNLKLALEETSTGCIMKVTDARHGHIDDMTSYADGWRQIFTDGLKKYVES